MIMELQLAFLGTGTCNASDRNPSSLAITDGSDLLLLDAGGGAYHQIARLANPEFNYRNISTIFLTHFHIDHISGLPDILWGEMWDSTGRRSEPLTIVGPRGLNNFYSDRLLPFMGDYPLPFEVRLVELADGESYTGSFYSTKAYHLEHVEYSSGYLFEFEGLKFAYTGDTGYCEPLVRLLSDSDIAVMEWSISDYKSFPGHLSTGDIITFINLGIFPEKVYINHMYLPHGISFEDQVRKNKEIFKDMDDRVYFPRDLDIIRLK